MTKTAVVALGGNALTRLGQSGTAEEMAGNAAAMAASVNDVIEAGWRVVIVHGNGPQVGNLALQQEATTAVPAQPLSLLNAMTQGELGSLIASAVNALRGPGAAVAVITHVTVSPADLAFAAPSKPIGPFFGAGEARRLAATRGWVVHPDSGRGFRRVVPSPEPTGIVEISAIRALVDAGCLVIACGGGGIPVDISGERAVGIDAVIDKDRAASLVARLLGAQALVLVTAVDHVMINYGTPGQAALRSITVEEAERHLRDGQFPPGSMGPKVEAALSFLAGGGEWAAITSPSLVAATLSGEGWAGTRIKRSPSRVVQGSEHHAGPGFARHLSRLPGPAQPSTRPATPT